MAKTFLKGIVDEFAAALLKCRVLTLSRLSVLLDFVRN